jgi:hypothetical protein
VDDFDQFKQDILNAIQQTQSPGLLTGMRYGKQTSKIRQQLITQPSILTFYFNFLIDFLLNRLEK